MNFSFRPHRLLTAVVTLSFVALLTLSANADVITKAFDASEAVTLGNNDILVIKGTGNDNQFSYQNYSGSGTVYFNPGGYSYFTASVPTGYTNTKVYIAGNALGLQNSKTSSDVYGEGRIIVLTNEVPTQTGIASVNEGTLFNAQNSSPIYDNDIQIKGVGGLRVGWNLNLTVSGKISDYKDANGNVTPGKLIIEKDGTDIRITNWNNDYSGGTQIGGGNVTSGSNATTLTIQPKPDNSTGATPLGTGPIYFGSDNSKLDMDGNTISISAVDNQKAAGGNYSGNSIVNADNPMASPTFNAAEGANYVYTGSLPTISGTLTKTGVGSQTIVTADVDNVNVTAGTMGFSGALKANSVTIASGATLKMTGTGSSLTVANPIAIQDGATLYFENAVPRNPADTTLAINIAEGGTLKFSETNTANHNTENSLYHENYGGNIAISGNGSIVKTGTGKLFMVNADKSKKYNLTIVLDAGALIDVQEGAFVNGGWNANCWKTTVDEVTTYNQATLNVGPNGTVDLWDGTFHVGGITGDVDGDNHGLIMSTNSGAIVVGMGMTDANKTFVYNGDLNLTSGRTFTKEGETTQTFTGTYSNLGTTNVNDGTLELAGTATLGTVNINKNTDAQTEGTLKISGGTTEVTGVLTSTGSIVIGPESTSNNSETTAALIMKGTDSKFTASSVTIKNGGKLCFEDGIPYNTANTTLAINLENGGQLEFNETITGEGNQYITLVQSTSHKISITGTGKFIKSGTGDLFVSKGSNVYKGLSIVLDSDSIIDVQEGLLSNGNYWPDSWKSTVNDVTTYNQATLNVGPNGTVDLWDGKLYVGGIIGGDADNKGGNIISKNEGQIIVGMGMTEAKSYTFYGDLDLNNSNGTENTATNRIFTKEGKTTQIFTGLFKNLGTVNVNDGTLEFSGTAEIGNFILNGGAVNITDGTTTMKGSGNLSNGATITVSDNASFVFDLGDGRQSQTSLDPLAVKGKMILKSGNFSAINISDQTQLELAGGIVKNNGDIRESNNIANINTDVYLSADSRLMSGWTNGAINVNGIVSGPAMLIIRDDSGTVYLNKSNTYEGGTQVGDGYNNNQCGRLVAGTENVLGTGRLYFIKNNSFFDMAGYAQTIGGLGKDMSSNEVQYTGSVNNSGAETTLTIDVPEGETYNFNGSVAKNVNIVKKGAGTQQFFIANLANAQLFSDSIVVNSGRLDMKEFFVGTLAVEADAVFSPGNSVGTLNLTGDFNLNGGTLLMEINGPMEADSDQLIISGDLNLNDGDIVLQFVNGMMPNAEFAVVIDADNSDDPDFDILSHIDSYYFSNLNYDKNGAGLWVLSGKIDANAVPEPSTWALLILGATGLLYWRKRR